LKQNDGEIPLYIWWIAHSFLLLSSVPLRGQPTICLLILLLINTGLFPSWTTTQMSKW
jgi:hypothetical protein